MSFFIFITLLYFKFNYGLPNVKYTSLGVMIFFEAMPLSFAIFTFFEGVFYGR